MLQTLKTKNLQIHLLYYVCVREAEKGREVRVFTGRKTVSLIHFEFERRVVIGPFCTGGETVSGKLGLHWRRSCERLARFALEENL